MASSSIVGVIEDSEDGKTTWHVVGVGGGDYATLCGMDGNDSVVGQYGTVGSSRGQKVDCCECKEIWLAIRLLRLTRKNFV